MADEIQDFIDEGQNRVYPGKWKRSIPLYSAVETDGIGILVMHDSEAGVLWLKAGVLAGLTFSQGLVEDVGKLNNTAVLGSFYLSQGEPGYWMVKYQIKLGYDWVDSQSSGSAGMILNSLSAVPVFVKKGFEHLSPKHGGEPFWQTPEDPENTFTWVLSIGEVTEMDRVMSWIGV